MSLTRQRLALVALALVTLLPERADAHPIGLAAMHVAQSADPSVFDVAWRISVRERGRIRPPALPASCVNQGPPERQVEGASRVDRWSVHCAEGLGGSLTASAETEIEVLVTLSWRDGRRVQGRLTPEAPRFDIPAPDAAATAAESSAAEAPSGVLLFLGLGFEHVLEGWDHLLFVLVLLMLAWPAGTRPRWGVLAAAITGFTLAHSITLALSVTGLVTLPGPPIEATIAWSVVVAAAALLRSEATDTPDWRRLMTVAAVFGLLHGFGFAGALREVLGDSNEGLASALLGFNLGVEAGQLLFAAGAVAVALALGRASRGRGLVDQLVGYGVGLIASFWAVERVVAFM